MKTALLMYSLLATTSMGNFFASDYSGRNNDCAENAQKNYLLTQEDTLNLKPFEGYYRFPNRVAYIQFLVKDGVLEARQLWDGRHYRLQSTGTSRFQSIEEAYPLEFNSPTSPSQVKILNRVVLSKVDFNPLERQTPSQEVLKRAMGKYRLTRANDMLISIFTKDSKLVLRQEWDNKEVILESMTDTEFINQDLLMPVSFGTSENGQPYMHCFENDIWEKVE